MSVMIPTWESPLWLNPKEPIFTLRVEGKDRCWLRAQRERDAASWDKRHEDPARAAKSRFANTLIRYECKWHDEIVWWPYERVRRSFVRSVVARLRSRMYTACKKYNAGELPVRPCEMAVEFLGCTPSELVEQLEWQMQSGMDWTNAGTKGWHIDHIQPLSMFDLRKLEHIKIACHATNLRPCWEKENLKKNRRPLQQGGCI